MARHAELADDEHIEGNAERGCNFVGDRHAATGQTEHDETSTAGERGKAPRELLSGFAAITEER